MGQHPVEGLGHKEVRTRELAGPSPRTAGQTWRASYGLAGGAQSRADPVQSEAFLFCIIIPSCHSQTILEKFVSCPVQILRNHRGCYAHGAKREGTVMRKDDRTEAGGSRMCAVPRHRDATAAGLDVWNSKMMMASEVLQGEKRGE